jgi:hypothetical protein
MEGTVSEGELYRLRRAVRRLFEGHREALEVLRQALEDDTPTEEALGDLEDILEGSLEDARSLLGMDEGNEA